VPIVGVIMRIVAFAIALGLGWSVAVAAAAAPPAAVACGPRAAHTLASTPVARVYISGRSVLGCAAGGGGTHGLGSAGRCPGAPHVGVVALAGATAAYALRTCGVDTSSAQVVVRALSSGRRRHAFDAVSAVLGPESFVTVGSIVVTGSGDVAWIGSASSIVSHRRVTQVLSAASGTPRVLASGPRIALGSLRLSGSTLSWRIGRTRQTGRF